MDNVERMRRQYGEYENEEGIKNEQRESGRLREIIERLRDEDNRQNHRIQEIENEIVAMRSEIQGLWQSHQRIEVALIGPDGRNGMRNTMQENFAATAHRIDQVSTKIERMASEIAELAITTKTIGKLFGGISAAVGIAGVLVAIVRTL